MKYQELVTIIIPVREIDRLTETCLQEIHTHYPEVETIIVCDALVDKTFTNVTQLKSDSPNLSFKRNLGVESANTPYIGFIDSDAYPNAMWIEHALDFLVSHPEAGIVGGPNLMHLKTGDDQRAPYLASKSRLVANEPVLDSGYLPTEIIASSNMFFRKKDYIAVGGMNLELFTGEDVELCFKINKQNYFIADSKVCHKQRQLRGFLKQRYVWGRGIFNVYNKVKPNYKVSLAPPLILLIGIVTFFISPKIFFILNVLYALIVIIEAIKLTRNPLLWIQVFPFLLFSIPAMGIGALVAILRGDINNDYSLYRNNE